MLYQIIFTCLLLQVDFLQAHERITSFVSSIFLNSDATIDVEETIEVVCEHQQIKHGIVREFPTKYKDRHGLNYGVGFKIEYVTHNGCKASYMVKNAFNGKCVYIGNANTFIPQGKHVYVIRYKTNRQLGFFKDYDELYWNVTGNGWRLPIEKAQAYVHLPQGISSHFITAEAYTGYQGEQGNNYSYSIDNNVVHFTTKHELKKFEGFTIVTTFPKGMIVQPSRQQELWWFVWDNIVVIWGLFLLLLLLIVTIAGIWAARSMNNIPVVVPVFHPPLGMTPSEVGFINSMNFRTLYFSADIVDLAVQEHLKIIYTPGMFYGGTYTLEKGAYSFDLSPYYQDLLISLFNGVQKIELSKKNHAIVHDIVKKCEDHVLNQCDSYIKTLKNYWYVANGLVSIIITSIVYAYYSYDVIFLLVALLCAIVVVAFFAEIFKRLFSVYTPAGKKYKKAIAGFKMYLMFAEVDRMKIIGTPPIKTPELYEKYLPYAIALGVEKQWTQQFAAVFDEILRKTGRAYDPVWHSGRDFTFHNFGSSLSMSISSAATQPGSSSGSGGKGGSGGGGGGGGGGGW